MDPSGIILSENPALKQIMGHGPGDTMVGVNILNEPAVHGKRTRETV